MKKSLLIILALCLCFPLMAAPKKSSKQKAKGAHPYLVAENKNVSQEFSHWALTPHIGFNVFDGDFNSEMKHNFAVPTAGLALEYHFTPVWTIGVQYMFEMYGVAGKASAHNAKTLLSGNMHKIGTYLSLDLVPLFFPLAKKRVFGLQPLVSAGHAWYKNSTMYFDDSRHHTAEVEPFAMDKYDGAFFLGLGLDLDFNINRTLSVGLRTTYDYFMHDRIDGRGYAGEQALASKNNDGIFDVTLNMRFKLEAVKKTHVRNISGWDVWKPEVKPLIAHDTVIIRHDSVVYRERVIDRRGGGGTTIVSAGNGGNTYYVYFNNGTARLDEKGLITVQQVADRLEEDSTLFAVVTGYCDNTGSAKANYILGDKRAESVLSELEEEYGISADHLYAAGLGKLIGKRSQAAYGPNRRAVIRLVNKATFEQMKAELEEKRANREDEIMDEEEDEYQSTPVNTIPLSESQRPVKVNAYRNRGGEIVTTEASTTLSKLARKYYNNTYCWVYIYIANKDKIKNPNSLTPGIQLTIPELTEQEMRITKDQGLVLYGNARQIK